MIDRESITQAAGEALAELGIEGLFLVEVKIHGDEAEVYIDSDSDATDEATDEAGEESQAGRPHGVDIGDCAALTRAIEGRFDRDVEDFSLTVSSAGIGQPLRVARQFHKLVGHAIEVVLADGTKLTATLESVDTEGNNATAIAVSYAEKQRLESQKRPKIVAVTRTIPLTEIKSVSEHIDFK